MRYNNGGVSVDDNFARFASKSYAIDKINTVDVRVTKPHGMAPVIIFGIFSVLSAFAGIGAMQAGAGGMFFVIAAVCVGIAYWAWTKTKIRDFHLYLMTSSSEAQAYSSRDADEIATLRECIENAMTQGRRMNVQHNVRMVRDEQPIDVTPTRSGNIRQRLLG